MPASQEAIKVKLQSAARNQHSRQGKSMLVNESSIRNPQQSEAVMGEKYFKCILDPMATQSRIPDAKTDRTSLFYSTKIFVVPAVVASGSTIGRFSFAVQPKIGGTDDPTQYQVALIDGETDWPTDNYDSALNYKSFGGGNDLRLDMNYSFMTQPPPANARVESLTSTATVPFQTWATNTTSDYDVNVSSGMGVTPRIVVAGAADQVYLPPGQYNIYAYCASVQANWPTSWSVVGYDGGVVYPVETNSNSWNGYYYTSGNGFFNMAVVGGTAGNKYYMVISRSFNTTVPTSADKGIIRKIRPVAQTVLSTFMGSDLVNGGEISIARVPAESLRDRYFVQTPDTTTNTPLQDWENLAAVAGAYNGKLSNGAWSFWFASDEPSTELRSPDEMNNFAYGGIVCSGAYQTNVAAASDTLVAYVRVVVTTCYEYTNDTQLFAKETCLGSIATVEKVRKSLSLLPSGYENRWHTELIARAKAAAAKAVGFYQNHREFINPILTALGQAALAL